MTRCRSAPRSGSIDHPRARELTGLRLTSVSDPALAGYDDIIDVRSPSEFADDHIPGAINLPVLDDQQRAEVGTIYRQVSPFDARKLGGALVAANAAKHIAGRLSDRDGGWRPLVYCWRGGQRSGAFSTILRQIGWRADLVEGGYKSWRRLVVATVQDMPIASPAVVLDGNTGSAKTAVLVRLAARGVQVVDLEGLANHRGSLFGGMPGGQPAQRLFESRLACAIAALDPARPVVFEAESSRIGDIVLPKAIWQAICAAPRIRLAVPVRERAAYTARFYGEATGDAAQIVSRLRPLHPADRIDGWLALARAGDWAALAEGLMQHHYDPRYDKHRARYSARERAVLQADRLDDAGIDTLAAQVQDALPAIIAEP